MTDQQLGQFVDRYTMRYERFYPHPVERVWEALTTAEHIDAWMMPMNHVDAKPGGSFSMSFGGDEPMPGSIAEFRPNELIDYRFDNGSAMRFELESVEGGTKLAFVHSFTPADEFEAMEGDPGGDLPGGTDTPWRPGFTAGFHGILADLGLWLDGDPDQTVEAKLKMIEGHVTKNYDPEWLRMCDVYRDHITRTIPAR